MVHIRPSLGLNIRFEALASAQKQSKPIKIAGSNPADQYSALVSFGLANYAQTKVEHHLGPNGRSFLLPSGLCSTCVGRSPPPVLGGIQLSGLPWSPAGVSSTTFGLAPHGSAVSSRSPLTSRSPYHRPWWVGSRFCSGASRLRLRLSTPCVLLRGRNFPRRSP